MQVSSMTMDPQAGASATRPPASSSAGAMASAGESGSAGAAMTTAGAAAPEPPAKPFVTEPADEAAFLFDPSKVRTYNILVEPADLAAIDAKPSAETWVPARLEFEGATYGPFKMRYKGSSGSFKAPCTTGGFDDPKSGKCSIKLGFDEVDEELRFFGLKKLNFHAMIQDTSLLRDRLGYSLFRDSEIAAPRAMHAIVQFNGELEGLFIAVEQIDGRFTRARFSEGGEGNVYKESWVTMHTEKDFVNALETNSDAPVVTAMLDFQDAVQAGAVAVEKFIDRDYMMRYVAVDRVIANDDGVFHFYCDANSPNYLGTSHNFYWYQAEKTAQFWLIPWDLDLSFDLTPWVRINPAWTAQASCTCVRPEMYDPQTPPSCDPMVKHFLSWRDDYEREVDKFISGPFADSAVQAKLNAWIAQLRPYVMQTAGVKRAPSLSEWDNSVSQLYAKIATLRSNRGVKY
jgi:spore coat protein H